MSLPIIIMSGYAGSGKDTVGAYLAEHYNAATIALADPMKRFVRDVFGFSNEALWGPSAERNKEVSFSQDEAWHVYERFSHFCDKFVQEMLSTQQVDVTDGIAALGTWFNKIYQVMLQAGKISPRTVLQLLGTEWGRTVAPTMWVDYAVKVSKRLLSGGCSYSKYEGVVEKDPRDYDYVVITDGRFRNELIGVLAVGGITVKVDRPSTGNLSAGVAGHRSEREMDGIPRHFYTEWLDNSGDFDFLFGQVDDAMAISFGDLRMGQPYVKPVPNLQ